MKDIFEILKENGVEVEADKQKDIRKAFSENYKTINEFNEKTKALNNQLSTANNTITDLKGKLEDAEKIDVKALQDRIKDFEDAEKTRKATEAAAKETEALKARFAPLKGDKNFLNEGTENWMFDEFRKAAALDENKGKSDAEIYEAVSKDKNIYENPNKVAIPPVGNLPADDAEKQKAREIMGLNKK